MGRPQALSSWTWTTMSNWARVRPMSTEHCFFAAFDREKGTQLMKSDGTAAGTVVVKDLYRADGSRPSELLEVNGALFFAAQDIKHGNELWKTDGTVAGTVLVKDLNPGTASSNPSKLFNMDGTLFFWTKDDENSWKLWKSDGTGEGTALVSVFEGTENRDPGEFANVNGTVCLPEWMPLTGSSCGRPMARRPAHRWSETLIP